MRDRVEHALTDAPDAAPLGLGVVLDGHSGQLRDLAATQTCHAPGAATGREPCLTRTKLQPV